MFQATEVKPNHPAKPLETARTLFAAMVDGSTYEASIALRFEDDGRARLSHDLKGLAEKAGEGIAPSATFGRAIKVKEAVQ